MSEAEFVLVPERLAVRIGGQEVAFTATQFRIFAVLLQAPGRVFSRTELVARAIGEVVTEMTINTHIAEIRRKLGRYGARIETVRQQGYRFVVPS